MREISTTDLPVTEAASLAACLATILELPLADVPLVASGDPVAGSRRWLNGLGLGLVAIENAKTFSWPGPWIGWARSAGGTRGAVVMFGVPSGVVWDPIGAAAALGWTIDAGHIVCALDIALARPPRAQPATTAGTIEAIWIATAAKLPAEAVPFARAIAGLGLDGDRHVAGTGTFPSQQPGSALTLIEGEVCDSFTPPLSPDEHRRNLVTRGIELARLVGREFRIGEVVCRGMRLCEPCTVIQGYSQRPILRPLVHRGGLRADILVDGVVRVGDRLEPI